MLLTSYPVGGLVRYLSVSASAHHWTPRHATAAVSKSRLPALYCAVRHCSRRCQLASLCELPEPELRSARIHSWTALGVPPVDVLPVEVLFADVLFPVGFGAGGAWLVLPVVRLVVDWPVLPDVV